MLRKDGPSGIGLRAKGVAAAALVAVGGAISADATNIWVVWDPSPDPTAFIYNIYYSTNKYFTNFDNSDFQTVSVGAQWNYVLATNLQFGAVYYFAATVENSSGVQSPISNEQCWTSPPAPPTGLRIIGYNPSNLEGAVVTLSPSIWSLGLPHDSKIEEVELVSRKKSVLRL